MISIRKLLSQDASAEQALMHVVRILIEGIGQHAVPGEPEDCARFQESIRETSASVLDGVSAAELLVCAGSVLKGLEEYNRRAGRHMRAQTTELQNMVKMLASTVSVISEVGQSSVGVLADIEKQVATVSELDDVRLMKAKLAACLIDIRKEADRQRKETGETIEQLNRSLAQARERGVSVEKGEERDPVTGLLTRPDAEAAIARAGRSGSGGHVAVLVLDRLRVLNQRFGREVGDEILISFAGMIRKQLGAQDNLFRWGGPALLALIPGSGSLERLRGEVGRVMETKLEHTIQTPSRSILIPIAARWTLLPLMAAPRLMYQKIDNFAANPDSRD